MSLLNEVQKFIEAHPGCTSGDIADAFAGYSRQRVLQSASKLRQSGRVAHRCEGDTRRHFPRLTERAQEPELSFDTGVGQSFEPGHPYADKDICQKTEERHSGEQHPPADEVA